MKHIRKVQAELKKADAITTDYCHKIYILIGEKEIQEMKKYDYEITYLKNLSIKESTQIVRNWYDNSCPLRLVDTIEMLENGEEVFTTVIGQGE